MKNAKTTFINPNSKDATVVIEPIDYSIYSTTVTPNSVNGIINVGPANAKYGIGLSAYLMKKLKLKDGDIVSLVEKINSPVTLYVNSKAVALGNLVAVNDNFVTPASINRVFDNTFLGKIKETKEDVLKMFENFFVVLNPKSLA